MIYVHMVEIVSSLLGHYISLQVRECISHFFNSDDFIRTCHWSWSSFVSL